MFRATGKSSINPFGIVIDGNPPKFPICKCSSKAAVSLSNMSFEPSKCFAGPLPTGNITASYFLNKFFQVSTSSLLTLWALWKYLYLF